MSTNTLNAADTSTARPARPVRSWPLLLLALPAFVAIWAGWVGLGTLTGFGRVQPLPGTPLAGWTLDTRITLPIGVETYAAYALNVWLSGRATGTAARFAKWSAIGALLLGAAGQGAYHLMEAAHVTAAPWWITAVVACLPVAVLGMGAALAHLTTAVGPVPEHLLDQGSNADGQRPTDPASLAESHDQGEAGQNSEGPGQADNAHTPGSDTVTPGPAHARQRTRTGPSDRPARTAGTAAHVARLRQRHPDMPAAEIARRLGVTDRTVRRHLAADNHPTPTAAATPAASQAA